MTRMVKIASVQLPAFPPGETWQEKKEANLRAAQDMLCAAGEMGADIAALGEIANIHGCGYSTENLDELTRGDVETVMARFGPLARRYHMYLIFPLYARVDGIMRNTALLFDRDGALIGQYHKVHCIEDERAMGVVPGDTWPVFKLDFGSIGIMTCHDNSFPESARCLTVNGAEVIFWPHVMGGWGDVFMDILLRAPAIHNGIYLVPICYGCEPEMAWQTGVMLLGRSSIVGPDATIVADAGRYKGIAFAGVDLDHPRIAHMWTRSGEFVYRLDMLIDRRPDTYGCLLRPTPAVEPLKGADIDGFQERVEQVNRFIEEQEQKENG